MIEFVVSTLSPCSSAIELQDHITDNVMLNNTEYETTAFSIWFLAITYID